MFRVNPPNCKVGRVLLYPVARIELMNVTKTVLLTAATARAVKVITGDTIGDYLIHDPINRKVNEYLQRKAEQKGYAEEPAWLKYLDGLKCPWCIGFWVGGGVLLAEQATRNAPRTRAVGKLTAEALALNLVTAPIVAHLSE